MNFTDKDITIIENATSLIEQREILKNLKSSIWRYGWPINNAYFSRPCWHSFIAGSGRPDKENCEPELALDTKWQALSNIWKRIKSSTLPSATLLGVYANGQTFGQDSPIHRDNNLQEHGTTVLLFCNEHWATCWGGRAHLLRSAQTGHHRNRDAQAWASSAVQWPHSPQCEISLSDV